MGLVARGLVQLYQGDEGVLVYIQGSLLGEWTDESTATHTMVVGG